MIGNYGLSRTTADMIDILSHARKYVPAVDGEMKPILFGGDQVTQEQASNAQDAKLQSKSMARQLKGLIPKSEDWHCRICLYQVSMHSDCKSSVYNALDA